MGSWWSYEEAQFGPPEIIVDETNWKTYISMIDVSGLQVKETTIRCSPARDGKSTCKIRLPIDLSSPSLSYEESPNYRLYVFAIDTKEEFPSIEEIIAAIKTYNKLLPTDRSLNLGLLYEK